MGTKFLRCYILILIKTKIGARISEVRLYSLSDKNWN